MSARSWWLVTAAAALVAVVVVRRRRRSDGGGDVVPARPERQETLIDLASEESFPASDPPAYWGRDAV